MDPIFLLGGLAVALLAYGAWRRTTELNTENERLDRRLTELADRLAGLEQAEADRRRHARASPTVPTAVTVAETSSQKAPSAPVESEPQEAPAERAPAEAPEPTPEPKAETLPELVPSLAAAAPAPAEPNPVMAWLLRGNPLAKVGVVLMFFGLAYLLRFASERGLLPIEIRLVGAAVISMALLVVGWRLRTRMPVYALTLQGGSIGALYLTSFAAFRFYSLLPHGLVFALLVVICAASVTLAVLQRAQSLALLASLGGYLAPILLSTGGGNHVALFSYYTLLSAGILAVSLWQAWRPLNLIGFAFTFVVGALWGASRYEPSMYASTQILLALNVLIYGVLAAVAAVRRSVGVAEAVVDGTLVFGAPLLGFGLQVGLTRHWEYGPAFSSLAYGAGYLPLAWFTMRRWPETARRLTLSFLALGGTFVTLAIPLALSARWTSMAWSLEGLGILWVGRAQANRRMIWSGTALLGLAAYSAWMARVVGLDTPTLFMVGGTLALTWLAAGWMWSRDDADRDLRVSPFLLLGGVTAWVVVVIDGSGRLIESDRDAVMLALIVMSLTTVIWTAVSTRTAWRPLGELGALLWPFAFSALLLQVLFGGHPFGAGWWSVGWLAAILSGWHLLRWGRDAASRLRAAEHATYVWLLFGVAVAEAAWRLRRLGWEQSEWRDAGTLVVASAFVFVLWRLRLRKHWAVTAYPRAYWIWALLPALLVGGSLVFSANLLDGRSPGWPYVPVLNPIELAAAFALLMGVVWFRELVRGFGRAALVLRAPLIVALVWWINGLLLRTLSTIGGVDWTAGALWGSAFLQTSMALAWTVAALVCMAVAARRAHREAWFIGAAALAAVVLKLFLVDSARGGGLARAIAFIGVAALVLVIGYLAPLPPRGRDGQEAVP